MPEAKTTLHGMETCDGVNGPCPVLCKIPVHDATGLTFQSGCMTFWAHMISEHGQSSVRSIYVQSGH